jgi:hypothetical protein
MSTMRRSVPLSGLLGHPTRHLFFTGKGGVGKTSLACAVAISLSDRGKKVLLVSTDPASNLDEMLEIPLGASPTRIPGTTSLFAMSIDPDAAAESYRQRVLDQLPPRTNDKERQEVREQLSGSCTTEIAAFEEFVGLLAETRPATITSSSIRLQPATPCACSACRKLGRASSRTMTAARHALVRTQA